MSLPFHLEDGRDTRKMSLREIESAAVAASGVLDAFGGHGIPTDAYNSIVDLCRLVSEVLNRIKTTEAKTKDGRPGMMQ